MAPGQVGTFVFPVKMPSTVGTYREHFRPVADGAAWFGPVMWLEAQVRLAAPSAPRNLASAVAPASGVGSGQVGLSWNAPSSVGGSAVTDYLIQRSTDGVNWTTVNDGVSTALSYTATGLTNGTTYHFRVIDRGEP